METEIKVYNLKGEYIGTFDEVFGTEEEEALSPLLFKFAKFSYSIMRNSVAQLGERRCSNLSRGFESRPISFLFPGKFENKVGYTVWKRHALRQVQTVFLVT